MKGFRFVSAMLAMAFVFGLAFISCQWSTESGERVGPGNAIVAIIISAIFTAIALFLARILGKIPSIGKYLSIIIKIAIIIWWILVIIASVASYGWFSLIMALVIILVLFFIFGGPMGFMKWFLGSLK